MIGGGKEFLSRGIVCGWMVAGFQPRFNKQRAAHQILAATWWSATSPSARFTL